MTAITTNNIEVTAEIGSVNIPKELDTENTPVTIFSSNRNGSVIEKLWVHNPDTVSHVVEVIKQIKGEESTLFKTSLSSDTQLQYTRANSFSVISGSGGGGGTQDVDIVAQTVGNINVDIAEQSAGNINVDIAEQSLSPIVVYDQTNRLKFSSETIVQFDTQFQYSKQDAFWGESGNSGTGAATHLPDESSVSMTTGGTASGATCRRRTNTWPS